MKTLDKLNSKSLKIVNQIMSADTIDISHGPVVDRISSKDIYLTHEGLECSVDVDGDDGVMLITNDTLNSAYIEDTIIQIDSENIQNNEFGDMTITLYKLSKLAAV